MIRRPFVICGGRQLFILLSTNYHGTLSKQRYILNKIFIYPNSPKLLERQTGVEARGLNFPTEYKSFFYGANLFMSR